MYRLKKTKRKEKKTDTIKNPFGGTSGDFNPGVQPVYPGYPPVSPLVLYPYYPPAPFQTQPTDFLIAILALIEKKQMDREKREEQERQSTRNISDHHYHFTSLRPDSTELQSSPVQEDLEEYIQWHI